MHPLGFGQTSGSGEASAFLQPFTRPHVLITNAIAPSHCKIAESANNQPQTILGCETFSGSPITR